ncbi:MAG: hypothetical protein RIS84_1792 [Pseudomonadota bacterium]|jgi:KDO2-lipid IV(A) lauroyltransferase
MKVLLPLLAPRYWGWWIVVGLLWSLTRLPHAAQLRLGRGFGAMAYRLAKRRRRIAEINIKACFPELAPDAQQTLVREHFAAMGMGIMEMLSAWWCSDAWILEQGEMVGLEHLKTALARGKGVMLLTAHFTALEIGTRFLTMQIPVHASYRSHENLVFEYVLQKSRAAHAEKAIHRDDVREMLRSLRKNKALWFAPDQNFGHKYSVFARFFGIPAATNTATARFAEMTGAVIVPFVTRRQNDRYHVEFFPAFENYPSGDTFQDAQRVNDWIEAQIREIPEQYLWTHRRFKDRPEGETPWY